MRGIGEGIGVGIWEGIGEGIGEVGVVGGVEGGGEGGGEDACLDAACVRARRQDQLCLRVAEEGGGIGEGIMEGIGEGIGEVGVVGRVEGGGVDGGLKGVVDGGLNAATTRKMQGLRRKQRKFTRTLDGRAASGSDQKVSGFNYAALREENDLLRTANAQQISATLVPAKARSPLSKDKRERSVLRASLESSARK